MKFWLILLLSFITALSLQAESIQGHKLKIAYISSTSVIGKYSKSCYDVSLASLLSYHLPIELISYSLPDESSASIERTLTKIKQDNADAIIAPLTLQGAQNLINTGTNYPVFIPTVHKRDVSGAAENFVFGAIDYRAQLEAMSPYMGSSIAIFYTDSLVGSALNTTTKEVAASQKQPIAVSSHPVDIQGAKIVSYLSKPAAYSKKSIISHLPIVKTSMLISHLTFTGVREKNILSTQVNYDPYLLTLTQYNDRKNMIIANSIVEQVPSIYESNAFMQNDLTYDWILYTTSVGIDTLVAHLTNTQRLYSFRILNSQIIYPIELLRPGVSSFEPLNKK